MPNYILNNFLTFFSFAHFENGYIRILSLLTFPSLHQMQQLNECVLVDHFLLLYVVIVTLNRFSTLLFFFPSMQPFQSPHLR